MAEGGTKDEKAFVTPFLTDNKVKKGWKNLILKNESVLHELSSIIQKLELTNNDAAYERYAPEPNNILRAFAHCKPENIRVVIIGTSPITKGMANGLSFSTDLCESKFKDNTGAAIRRVHDALREAKILKEGVDYHCGHEEWAKRGVLLLNAALTIRKDSDTIRKDSDTIRKDSDTIDDIFEHCLTWRSFLQCLLKRWIRTTKLKPSISVMLWGYATPNYPNYAEKVWEGIVPQDCNVFKVYSAHHPTWPYEGNNFIDTVSVHFKNLPKASRKIFKKTKSKDEMPTF